MGNGKFDFYFCEFCSKAYLNKGLADSCCNKGSIKSKFNNKKFYYNFSQEIVRFIKANKMSCSEIFIYFNLFIRRILEHSSSKIYDSIGDKEADCLRHNLVKFNELNHLENKTLSYIIDIHKKNNIPFNYLDYFNYGKELKMVSNSLRFEILKKYDFKCIYCGRSPPLVYLTLEHIKPKSIHNNNLVENLAPCCEECNNGKNYNELSIDSISSIKSRFRQCQINRGN